MKHMAIRFQIGEDILSDYVSVCGVKGELTPKATFLTELRHAKKDAAIPGAFDLFCPKCIKVANKCYSKDSKNTIILSESAYTVEYFKQYCEYHGFSFDFRDLNIFEDNQLKPERVSHIHLHMMFAIGGMITSPIILCGNWSVENRRSIMRSYFCKYKYNRCEHCIRYSAMFRSNFIDLKPGKESMIVPGFEKLTTLNQVKHYCKVNRIHLPMLREGNTVPQNKMDLVKKIRNSYHDLSVADKMDLVKRIRNEK
jgi:hypothetical protein